MNKRKKGNKEVTRVLDNQPSRVSLLNENGDASVRQSRNYNDRSGVRDSNGSIAEIRTTGKKWASVRVGSIQKAYDSAYKPNADTLMTTNRERPNVDTLMTTGRDSSVG